MIAAGRFKPHKEPRPVAEIRALVRFRFRQRSSRSRTSSTEKPSPRARLMKLSARMSMEP
jgi:hypothetical protein